MIGHHHAIVAAAGYAAIHTASPQRADVKTLAAGLAISTVCGLLPDIDEDGSIVSRTLGPVGWVLSKAVGFAAGGHRGATHTLPAVALVAAAVWFATRDVNLTAAAGWGYLSHLIGDTLTPMGVPWLWPVQRLGSRLSVGLFTTGTAVETWVTYGWVAVCALLIYRQLAGQ